MNSFTPGPWREGIDGNNRVYGPDGCAEHSGLIAVVYKGRGNVLSIAAVPDLVEALQEARTQISLLQSMRGIVDTGHGTLSIIDAALAKAGVKVEMEDAGQ